MLNDFEDVMLDDFEDALCLIHKPSELLSRVIKWTRLEVKRAFSN
jgi:hypothetical protein